MSEIETGIFLESIGLKRYGPSKAILTPTGRELEQIYWGYEISDVIVDTPVAWAVESRIRQESKDHLKKRYGVVPDIAVIQPTRVYCGHSNGELMKRINSGLEHDRSGVIILLKAAEPISFYQIMEDKVRILDDDVKPRDTVPYQVNPWCLYLGIDRIKDVTLK